MKLSIRALILFTSFGLMAQSKMKAPSKTIYKECETSSNPKECLYDIIQNKFLVAFDQAVVDAIVKKNKRDTIIVRTSIMVGENGKVDPEFSRIFTYDKTIGKRGKEALTSLSDFNVELDNMGNPISEHLTFDIFFTFNREAIPIKLVPLPMNTEFDEGIVPFAIIEEVPVFPGCEGVSNNERRDCFQQKMHQHIAYHFKYPRKAQRKKISGRVYAQFTIEKDGTIKNIKVRGPHKLLEEETLRIIEKLPKMKPGLHRGKPVRTPFSIPLTFKLK